MTALTVQVTKFDGALKYELLLVGDINPATRGDLTSTDTFRFHEVQLKSVNDVVVHAVLPKSFDVPTGLIHPSEDRLRTSAELKTKIDELIANNQKALADRFRALRAEALRRLRNIEVDWSDGAFLDTTAGNVKLKGEARLALGVIVGDDGASVSGAALAEFRATVEATITITGKPFQRNFGVVVRCDAAAFVALPATLSIDVDDLNISLPEIKLETFNFATAVNLELPTTFKSPKLGGAFSALAKHLANFDVEHKWVPDKPVLVVRRDGVGFLFAVMDPAKVTDLSAAITDKTILASLTATASDPNFSITAKDVKFAVHKGGTILDGTFSVTGKPIEIGNGQRTIGPLRVEWEGVFITPVFTSDPTASAEVSFRRVMIYPIDDPSAVIAFRGRIEINPSGTRVLDLELVEPYPFVLAKNAAGALLRGAQKIIQLLGQLKPQSTADIEGLKKVLEVLGRIAAAVARAAFLVVEAVGNALAGAAELLAKAVIAMAELLVDLLKQLAKLIPSGTTAPDLQIDVEIRIALEPFELRQVLLTLRGAKAQSGTAAVSVLGVSLAIQKEWRPAVLIDFVTQPGAYFMVFPPESLAPGSLELATIFTDLWLKRETTVAPVRDASKNGERDPDKPLLEVKVIAKSNAPLAFMMAGVSRGRPVFLQVAKNAVTAPFDVPGQPGVKAAVVPGPLALVDLDDAKIKVEVLFQPERVLPLLGMGDAGKTDPSTGPSFLKKLQDSLGQVVWVKSTRVDPNITGTPRSVTGQMVLGIKAAGVETEVALGIALNLETFEVALTGNAPSVFQLKSKRIVERALGLTWVVEQTDDTALKNDTEVEMFTLAFSGSESGFALTEKARMQLRFDGLSSDGQGVVFNVTEFRIGRGGLDLVAVVADRAVRLNGIDVPFRFTSGRLEIRGGKLVGAAIAGRGQLPPALVGEANCSAAFVFGFENGEIVLQSGKVELDKKGEPIVCHATRFTLTVTNLDIAFARDGGYHFYFLVTGSLRFAPKGGEFEDGLLKHLEDVEITLERTPLTSDPRVLLRHVSFQKALNPKKTFSLFDLFTFELRGFGFHPASPKFEGRPPALNISGQIRFADLGDVMQPKIDFHELWIAPPKAGESLPRIKAGGLGVELQLAGSVKIRGAVLAVDADTRTVEGREFAPDGFNTYGFLGEGAVDIPGFCSLEASMGFLEVERQDDPTDRKKAFFLYLQANKLAVEIPTPVWTFYLREVGFGFGYRYTLAGIKDAENAKSTAQLVRVLDDVSKRQGDLARFTAWKPDPEKDNVTLALRGAFQLFAAQKQYDEKAEKKAVSPLFFDIVAALRSDFTFLMSARGWVGVNYASFLENKDNFRERPTFRGYLYISVPRSELLLRGIADSRGFVGNDWPEVMPGTPLRQAIQSVDWSTTLYIRPGLFHYEMGWPDQLQVRLVDERNMRVVVRGGMIFRAAEEGVLFGFNIGADAFLRFEGRVGGSIGVALVAELNARFVARVLAFLAANFNGSLVYGLVSLDARLTFSVEAWMDVDLGFTSFTIRIGFSFSVQFTAAVELAISDSGMGGRVEARISVQVFGCSIGVGIGFSFNNGQLDAARARVERFLALSITAEEPDSPPVFAAKSGDKAIESKAETAEAVHKAPEKPKAELKDGLKPPVLRSAFGRKIRKTDFWLVMRAAAVDPDGKPPASRDFVYAMLVPKEAPTDQDGGFYSAPSQLDGKVRSETADVHEVMASTELSGVKIWKPGTGTNVGGWVDFKQTAKVTARWGAPIPVAGVPDGTFTLAHFFDECFLTDSHWEKDGNDKPIRLSTKWAEPASVRIHTLDTPLSGSRESRNQQRDQQQKAQSADAIEFPHDERAFQARSTLMTMFLDQFVTLSSMGTRTTPEAHVTDIGLVFYGRASEFATKLTGAEVRKFDESEAETGKVAIFNPRNLWFDEQDPVLANERSGVEVDGIKLDWQLVMDRRTDADSLLHHYEILRTIESVEFAPDLQIQERKDDTRAMRVKPAATVGRRDRKTNVVELVPPDWQFVDTLAEDTGVSAVMRRALLPTLGEAEGFEAAKAWLEVFGTLEEVTVTYSVTPVDVGGAKGLPRSFTVDVLRPQPAIRPAVGELRIVQTLRDDPAAEGAQQSIGHPDDLQVFLALNDRAWSDDADEEVTIGNIEYAVERVYRIVADPDEIEPAGNYGTDGATSRLRGPGAFAPKRTADEQLYPVPRDATVSAVVDPKANNQAEEKKRVAAVRAAIFDAETDDAEFGKLPRWALLDARKLPGGKEAVFASPALADAFRQFLWSGHSDPKTPVRVAMRFFLETTVVFESLKNDPKTGKPRRVEYVSKRVELPVEHVINAEALKERSVPPGHQSVAAIRPQAFEWSVPLVLPPLGEGQVRTESGFARFRVPKDDARITAPDLTAALEIQRDPERRVLTTVQFAAVPDWVIVPDKKKPNPAHGTSISGFDLYELDLDDLAPLDVKLPRLDNDVTKWQRARRVARIEHLSRENAQLSPVGNPDWQGWQAHYPSETRRVTVAREPEPKEKRRESRPIRSAWYSDRESTPHVAARRPRLRLLPQVPETAIADLMREGRPDRITARLVVPAGTPAFETIAKVDAAAKFPELDLHDVVLEEKNVKVNIKPQVGRTLLPDGIGVELATPQDKPPLTPPVLRNLLLCLGWKKFPDPYLAEWLKNPAAFDGLLLVLEGKVKVVRPTFDNSGTVTPDIPTGRAEIPLDLRSPLHPILEEVAGELALAIRGSESPATYRRYNVMPQPVTPLTTKDLSGFMAATAPETDPYGWQILQLLGSALTVRLFDAAEEAFVAPEALRKRVAVAMQSTLTRWRKVYDAQEDEPIFGQPFVEVFLRPGADRLAGPFDAVIDSSTEQEKSPPLDLNDSGLAFAQISLRPRPVAAFKYMLQSLHWAKMPEKAGFRLVGASIEVTMTAADFDVDVARAAGGPITAIEIRNDVKGRVAIPIPTPGSLATKPDEELALFFRVPRDVAQRPTINLILEWEQLKNGVVEKIPQTIPLPDAEGRLVVPDWVRIEEPATEAPDPFARFQPVAAERWTGQFAKAGSDAAKAFDGALREALRATAPQPFTFPAPEAFAMVVSPYLTWSQRFLDHGAPAKNARLTEPYVALAAPTKASPWKLAADAEGALTLGFLHSDRWAHARAYAVRPIPRYHQVLDGIGVVAQQKAEHFLDDFAHPLGVAVAVSPRTERIETPVITRARLITSDPQSTEIVVARHGEESLAASNRPLMARLGLPTSLLAFTRSYRMPGWPKQLQDKFGTPKAEELPVRKVEVLPKRPLGNASQIDGTIVREIAHDLPSLWKGADIWRVDPIPPHYRLIALASERAGIVVSDVASIVQEEQPRKALKSHPEDKLLPVAKIELKLKRGGGKVHLLLKHPLVSHKQLTPSPADAWLDGAAADDVSFWPDPDVIYLLLRRLERQGKTITEEEDADTRLVHLKNEPHPVIVRARGPRYDADVATLPSISATGSPPDFSLHIALKLREESVDAPPIIDRARLRKEEWGRFNEDITEFNRQASKIFAAILTPHLLTIEVKPDDNETGEKYLERLDLLRKTLAKTIEDELAKKITDKWFDGRLTQQLRQLVTDLTTFLAGADKALPAAKLHDQAGLPFRITTSWLRGVTFPTLLPPNDLLLAKLDFKELAEDEEPGVFLVVWDIADDTEIEDLMDACPQMPVANVGGRLYRFLARRILGTTSGFWIQAIDGRSRITFDKDGKPIETPGVIERKLKLPKWLETGAAQNQEGA